MTVYLDTSVVVRHFLQHPAALATWGDWEDAYASALLRIQVNEQLQRLVDRIHMVDLRDSILPSPAQSQGIAVQGI